MTHTRLAFTCVVVFACPVAGSHAQTADTGKPFLTGPCTAITSFTDLDSLVDEPEVRASVTEPTPILVPPAALRARVPDARVVAAFIVDTNGVVRAGTTTIMSSTDAGFSRWACDALPRVRFNAAHHHGRAVATQVVMPFNFHGPPSNGTAVPADSLRVYLEKEVEKQVTLDRPVFPRYPPDLRKQRIEGRVQAQFVVDTTGRAEMGTFKVLRTTDTRFIEAVRLAVAASMYHPAEFHGHKVRQMVQEPFEFALSPVNLSSP
jgi:outer membrane biosynthesis protein TonB